MNNFGKNLRSLRIKNNLKQEDMEQPLGVKPQTWSNYENGKTEPPMGLLISISKFFGVGLDDLILGELEGKLVPPAPKKKYSPQQEPSPSLAENDVQYLVREFKRLREEVDGLLQSGAKK